MSWTGKPRPFTINLTLQNLQFSKWRHFMVLWLVHLLNLVCSFQRCVLFMFDQTLAEQLARDKGSCSYEFSQVLYDHVRSCKLLNKI